jgi:hypothetical protein
VSFRPNLRAINRSKFWILYPILLVSNLSFGGNSIPVDYQLPADANQRAIYTRSFSCYVFDAVNGTHAPECTDALLGSLETSSLPIEAQEGLKESLGHGLRAIRLEDIRAWWNNWAYSLRNSSQGTLEIPETLAEFEQNYHFKDWPKLVISKSRVKNKTRVIYRSTNLPQNLSVSETLDSTTGDLNALILETEIARERSDQSGHHDFFVYDSAGNLANSAHFPAGERAAPSTCLSCHYSGKTGRFERVGR